MIPFMSALFLLKANIIDLLPFGVFYIVVLYALLVHSIITSDPSATNPESFADNLKNLTNVISDNENNIYSLLNC